MLLIFLKILFKKTTSYSQYLQDIFIDFVFFESTRNGYFIDIGAYDGITISNTYYFEKNKQWNGVAVEPNKIIFEKLKTNRTCNLVNGVISDIDGQVQYMRVEGAGEMLSGIVNNFADKHKQRIDTLIATYGGNKHIEEVNSYSIKNIIIQFQISSITILSIDTEGSEYEILKTFDFNKFDVQIFTIEHNYDEIARAKILNLMNSNGYERVYPQVSHQDDWFRK